MCRNQLKLEVINTQYYFYLREVQIKLNTYNVTQVTLGNNKQLF